MGKEHQPETVFKAQELYCVCRFSMTAVASEVGVATSTLWRWCKTYGWKDKRANLAQAECDIRADMILARSGMLKKLIEKQDPQVGFAVTGLEALAMKQAEAERAGLILKGQLEAPVRKIESKADAIAALREAVERKLTSALLDPEGTDVLPLAKQIKETNALIDSMTPKEDEKDQKKGLSAKLEAKIREMI
ncbi:hypothetical protein [Desulfovibrio sp. UCD-KL4C]|uniref:hypothetical protein n=1 Tax=Desulfovibrio sp. UCD-KL4C TaxID=2578120 RepID=UPI0025BE6D72|nr:hypothetical protein [Desulfovibrio sp. UCD-KL4C]